MTHPFLNLVKTALLSKTADANRQQMVRQHRIEAGLVQPTVSDVAAAEKEKQIRTAIRSNMQAPATKAQVTEVIKPAADPLQHAPQAWWLNRKQKATMDAIDRFKQIISNPDAAKGQEYDRFYTAFNTSDKLEEQQQAFVDASLASNKHMWDPSAYRKRLSQAGAQGLQDVRARLKPNWYTFGMTQTPDLQHYHENVAGKGVPTDPVERSLQSAYQSAYLRELGNHLNLREAGINMAATGAAGFIPFDSVRNPVMNTLYGTDVADTQQAIAKYSPEAGHATNVANAIQQGVTDTAWTYALSGLGAQALQPAAVTTIEAGMSAPTLAARIATVLGRSNQVIQPAYTLSTATRGAANTINALNDGQQTDTEDMLRNTSTGFGRAGDMAATTAMGMKALDSGFGYLNKGLVGVLSSFVTPGPTGEGARESLSGAISEGAIQAGKRIGGTTGDAIDAWGSTNNLVDVNNQYQQIVSTQGQQAADDFIGQQYQDFMGMAVQAGYVDPKNKDSVRDGTYKFLMSYPAKSGLLPKGFAKSADFQMLTDQQKVSFMQRYGMARYTLLAQKDSNGRQGSGFNLLFSGLSDKLKGINLSDRLIKEDPVFRETVQDMFGSADASTVIGLASSEKDSSMAGPAFMKVAKAAVLDHMQHDPNFFADLYMQSMTSQKTVAVDDADVKDMLTKIQQTPGGAKSYFANMEADKFVPVVKMFQTNTDGRVSKVLKNMGEDGKIIEKAFADAVEERAYGLVKSDPIKYMPIVSSMWLRTKGMNGLADITENPWVFYGGLTAILTGGIALLGGIFGGASDDEEEGTAEEDDETAYKKRIRKLYANNQQLSLEV